MWRTLYDAVTPLSTPEHPPNELLLQNVSGKLTSRDSTSLMEIHKQRLKKVAANPETLEDIDNTVLKS